MTMLASHVPMVSVRATPDALPVRRGLASLIDPEWLPFLGVALVPAAVCAAGGDALRASFFLGAAIYLAVLKYLGWLVLSRPVAAERAYLRVPAELFVGLAALLAWFFLRNLAARIWPASYSLRELSWLFPILLVVHLVAVLVQVYRGGLPGGPRAWVRPFAERLALCAPFFAALTAALASVSGTRMVLGVDPLHHAVTARAYLQGGLDAPVPPLGHPLIYPCGYAAMNAVTVATTPLDIVQAQHLQHVLWCVATVFLITTTVAQLAGRALPLLHSAALPFLLVFPLYALHPDIFYPGTPKQIGPPLIAALALLPLFVPMTGRSGALAVGAWAMLAPLTVALNPACGSYATGATVLGLTIYAGRATTGALSRLWAVATPLLLLGVSAALVLGQDPYVRGLIGTKLAPAAPASATDTNVPPQEAPAPSRPATPFFSPALGARQALSAHPFSLSPPVSVTGLSGFDHLRDWHQRPLQRALVPLALLLAALPLLGRALRHSPSTADTLALFRLTAVALALWFVVKYAGTFLGSGFALDRMESYFLGAYTLYLLPRCELLLLFAAAAAGLVLLTRGRGGSGTPARPRGLRALVFLGLACWLVPGACLGRRDFSGTVTIPTNDRFPVTEGDLRLLAWLDEHVPPERGQVALAGQSSQGGFQERERFHNALDAGPAFILWGRHANYRFALAALEPSGVMEEYPQRLGEAFDGAWCRAQGIHYVYVGAQGLAENPGLVEAIAAGRLRPVCQEGTSAIYEVVN